MKDTLQTQPDPESALRRLQEGNTRFAEGGSRHHRASHDRLHELETAQQPFAVILGCSDSRVPAEMIFDQGLGDLFVIRVAGNIVAPSQIGSVEFAAANLGTRLVVVLGHSDCGVIKATLADLRHEPGLHSSSLDSITRRVAPRLVPLLRAYPGDDDTLLAAATRTNVLASVERLRMGSSILRDRIASGQLAVVGAQYYLHTGKVDFFP